jgi:AbiEi antitoxin C-terminal domain
VADVGADAHARRMKLVVGSEALASASLTRGRLRWNYRAIFPDVYIARVEEPSLAAMTVGAWLWSRRRAIITGRAAAAMHGAKWVDQSAPVELLWYNNHHPPGIIVRNERFEADEFASVEGLTVATPARAGFDLARHLPTVSAVAHLDALARATHVTKQDLLHIVDRYPGARGNKRARKVIELMDAGAESPKESWLRLVLIGAGLPPPTTQIRVTDGELVAYLDMGWDEPMVALEYDGDHHRSDRRQYVKDIRRADMVQRVGWHVLRVIKEDRAESIVARASDALARRGHALPSPSRSLGRGAA